MTTFNSPPGWPAPPTPDWQPPAGWQPDPSWPPAPPGWSFWLNARGLRSRGPSGRYGAEPPLKLVAGWVAAGTAFLVILAAIGGGSTASTAVSTVPGPAVTVSGPTITVQRTVPGPTITVQRTVPGPTATITRPPLPVRTVTIKAPQATTTVTEPSPLVRSPQTAKPRRTTAPAEVYYANCSAVRAAGEAPLYAGDPGYDSHLDRDHDGVACE
jgi:hypothetical protein